MEVLNRNNYRIVHLTDGNKIEEAVSMINQNIADGINFNFIKKIPSNIDGIERATNLKHIQVNDYSKSRHFNYDVVNSLTSLEKIDIYTNDRVELKYQNFPVLQNTALYWRPKAKSLYECRRLKRLFLGKYTEWDLQKFSELEDLEYLRINTGSIKQLKGISALKKIKTLYLMQVTSLEDISEIESLQNIELIYIDNCKNINILKNFGKHVEIVTSGTTPDIK